MPHPPEHLLHAYLDGELAEPERAQVEAHLAECRDCATRINQWRVLFATLENLPETPLSRDLTPAVLREIRPSPNVGAHLRWLVGVELAAAVFILVITVPALYRRLSLLFLEMNISPELGFGAWWAWLLNIRAELSPAGLASALAPFIPIEQIATLLWLLLPLAAFWLLGNALLLRNGHRTT